MSGHANSEVVGFTVEGAQVTWGDIMAATSDVREWLNLKLTTGVCANTLIAQLAGHCCRMPQLFGNQEILVDVHQVYDQIGRMENATLTRAVPTKAATEFKRMPLKGLWHQHWFQALFLLPNLVVENARSGEDLISRRLRSHRGNDHLQGGPIDRIDIGLVAHAVVFDALDQRGERGCLTGEWIVFAKSRGRNIYLALGTHGDDEAIYRRCLPAVQEFPELRELECFRSLG
jgi:hypothetical protein